MRLLLPFILSTAFISSAVAGGQVKPDTAPAVEKTAELTYRLTFVVRETLSGKPAGSRTYTSLLAGTHDGGNSIRAGSRVPVSTGSGTQSQTQYIDIGANFDFRIPPVDQGQRVEKNQLALVVEADLSSVAPETSSAPDPLIRQNRWRSSVILELSKPTLLFSSQDPTIDRTTEVELTAVKLP